MQFFPAAHSTLQESASLQFTVQSPVQVTAQLFDFSQLTEPLWPSFAVQLVESWQFRLQLAPQFTAQVPPFSQFVEQLSRHETLQDAESLQLVAQVADGPQSVLQLLAAPQTHAAP